MKSILPALMTMLLLVTTSAEAQWGSRVKGDGDVVTESRNVGDYDEIEVSHIFKVTLVRGSEGTLTLEGEENLLDYVVTRVSGDRLKITVEKGVQLEPSKRSDGILVRVPVKDLDRVEVSGAADLTSNETFDFPRMRLECSGAGEIRMAMRSEDIQISASGASDIRLKGRAERLEIEASGASNVRAFDLQAEEVDAGVSGASDVRVHATERLEANASGAGSIRYKGDPERVNERASRGASIRKA